MPYNNLSDLPEGVKDHLPKHAQEIYLEAFNHAFQEYEDAEKRRADTSQEETAHRVAWAAVKKTYEKNEETGRWKRKRAQTPA